MTVRNGCYSNEVATEMPIAKVGDFIISGVTSMSLYKAFSRKQLLHLRFARNC